MLAFDYRKLLLPGVHDATLTEIEATFGRFQRSERRSKLFRKLQDYVKALALAECASSVIIDGSFVMGCVDEPEDIDLIVVLPKGWDWNAGLKPFQYNVISKRRVKREFAFDLFVVEANSKEEEKWVRFLSGVNVKWCDLLGWPLNSKKGLVRVIL